MPKEKKRKDVCVGARSYSLEKEEEEEEENRKGGPTITCLYHPARPI
jgi:hypothetical protein